ncbi:MAG: phage integrase N-terminal SAM-like domain-containing protein [Ardenticatenia bacterium]|nr:phage integrase N-terminal SAM-like domain-containing protein [Ardenticatenia bacterium]
MPIGLFHNFAHPGENSARSGSYSRHLGRCRPRQVGETHDSGRDMHYSPRTEDAYVGWIRRYILFHNKRHPKDMESAEVDVYLTHLTTDGNVAASTQNHALGALLLLYRHVLRRPLDRALSAVRAKGEAKNRERRLSRRSWFLATPPLVARCPAPVVHRSDR